MSSIRERFWVPRLRQLVKKLRLKWAGCKRFHAKAFVRPPPGILPKDRTEGSRPFEVIGVDYAGPIRYKCKRQIERKAYILLFACSLTRAVYIETVTDMTVEQFIPCLKGLVARRGEPSNIYSDNAKIFISGPEISDIALWDMPPVSVGATSQLWKARESAWEYERTFDTEPKLGSTAENYIEARQSGLREETLEQLRERFSIVAAPFSKNSAKTD
eukprot:gene15598-17171_t